MGLATPDNIRDLQKKLYVKAKEQPDYRFYSLYDKICRRDILEHAFKLSKSNGGVPGVDGVTFEQVESQGLESWLDELQEDLRCRRYRPSPVMRKYIPKPGGGERPLGIPTVRDRVVQTAAKLVLEPIFQAEFGNEMYGYRRKRSARDAVAKVHQALKEGYNEVVDGDLAKYFDTIPHSDLLKSLARRIADGSVLHLIKLWLVSPIAERDERGRMRLSGGKRVRQGTPQGGVISPLLANVYMNRFLRHWRNCRMDLKLKAKVVNYADDFVILCRGTAREALEITRRWMAGMKLQLNEDKTKLRDARKESFDFLGYTFGSMVYRPTGRCYRGVCPSKKAVAQFRERVRAILHSKNTDAWEKVVKDLNGVVRGWRTYFSYGQVARVYWWGDAFLLSRVRRFLVRRQKLPGRGTRRFPADKVFGELGVLGLAGT